jgi:hypothetical protein
MMTSSTHLDEVLDLARDAMALVQLADPAPEAFLAWRKRHAALLAAISAERETNRRNPYCANCGDERGGPYGHETSECRFVGRPVATPAPNDTPERDFCGCCGREIEVMTGSGWCVDCAAHVLKSGELWDRTWFAQFRERCPNDTGPDPMHREPLPHSIGRDRHHAPLTTDAIWQVRGGEPL